jgi:hypothetical protein
VEKAAPEEVRSLFNEFLPEAKIELKSQSSPKVVSGSASSNGKTNLLRDSDDNAATAFAS